MNDASKNLPGNKTLEDLVMPADKLDEVRRCHSGGQQKQQHRCSAKTWSEEN